MDEKYANLLAIIVVVLAIIYLLTSMEAADEVQKVPMYLTVGDHVGLNPSTSALWFGAMPPGASSRRDLVVVSYAIDYTKTAHISFEGELAAWSTAGKQDFELGPGQNMTVQITVTAPADAEKRDYTGTAVIRMKRSQ